MIEQQIKELLKKYPYLPYIAVGLFALWYFTRNW